MKKILFANKLKIQNDINFKPGSLAKFWGCSDMGSSYTKLSVLFDTSWCDKSVSIIRGAGEDTLLLVAVFDVIDVIVSVLETDEVTVADEVTGCELHVHVATDVVSEDTAMTLIVDFCSIRG